MIIDRFTKYIIFIFVCFDINTVELIKLGYIDIQFGLSLNIVFDRGSIFINKF